MYYISIHGIDTAQDFLHDLGMKPHTYVHLMENIIPQSTTVHLIIRLSKIDKGVNNTFLENKALSILQIKVFKTKYKKNLVS